MVHLPNVYRKVVIPQTSQRPSSICMMNGHTLGPDAFHFIASMPFMSVNSLRGPTTKHSWECRHCQCTFQLRSQCTLSNLPPGLDCPAPSNQSPKLHQHHHLRSGNLGLDSCQRSRTERNCPVHFEN